MKYFQLPDLGEGLQEAEIVAWHVAAGDHVVADQPLVSVETDKAVVEVPSPRSGRIAKLLHPVGERLEVGDRLVEFEQGKSDDAGAVVGEIATATPTPALTPAATDPARAISKSKATPAVRALAGRLDVDLSLVQPTGPDGTVSSDDVQRAAATLQDAGPAEPLRGVRRTMAQRMARAHSEVVPATVTEEADISRWIYNGGSVMVRLIQAMAAGCRAAPALNTWFDGRALTRRQCNRVDLGIAVNTEDGLFVPVLRDVGNRYAGDIKQGLERLKSDVKRRAVPGEELRGQTITLSNFGSLGGRFATLVVVPPQVAIVGAGRAALRVIAKQGEPGIGHILPLSVTFDHRAVSGAEATQFLTAMVAALQMPE